MSPDAELVLAAGSRAGDAGFLASADVADVAEELGVEYRLVGGNAVSLLVAVHGVGDLVPDRETADADFAAGYHVAADPRLLPALRSRGYEQCEGNRFIREHQLSAGAGTADGQWELAVDMLIPSYRSTMRTNQPHGDLVVDEVPGLTLALRRPPTVVDAQVQLTTGHQLTTRLHLPDVTSALCLKAYAYSGRRTDRDALDVWRLLEAALAAGVLAASWPDTVTAAEAGRILRSEFGRPGAAGPAQASRRPADQTRIRALVAAVLGPDPG